MNEEISNYISNGYGILNFFSSFVVPFKLIRFRVYLACSNTVVFLKLGEYSASETLREKHGRSQILPRNNILFSVDYNNQMEVAFQCLKLLNNELKTVYGLFKEYSNCEHSFRVSEKYMDS